MFRLKLFAALALLVSVVVLVAGCSQSVPEVKSSTAQPSGVSLSGIVYEISFTITERPIANATLTLVGKDASQTTTSGSDGKYVFSNLTLGQYTVIVSKEGYQPYQSSVQTISTAVDNYINVLNPALINQPYIVSITPVNGAVIPTTTSSFTVQFNEAMDTTTVFAYIWYNKIRAAGVSAMGLSSAATSWSADKKTMTITLNQPLTREGMYYLYLVGPDGNYTSIKDSSGYNLYYGSSFLATTAMYTSLTATTPLGSSSTALGVAFYTSPAAAAQPGVVSGLRLFDQNGSGDIDYTDVCNSSSNYLILTWNSTPDAVAYKVYGSYAGGPYQQIYVTGYGYNPINATSANFYVSYIDDSLADLTRMGSGTTLTNPIDPGVPWPFLGSGIDLKVAAINAFGETLSSAINAKDNVKPTVISPATHSGLGNTNLDISFSEPLERKAAENVANYTITGQSVSSAVLTNNFTSPTSTKVRLTLSPGTANGTVTVESGVTDVSGNPVSPTLNFATF